MEDLKSNSPCASTDSSTNMEPTTGPLASFTYHPSLERLNISPKAYLSANPTLTDLVVSAILFDKPLDHPATKAPPKTLLIQRAATDGYALYWECPGGGVELGQSSDSQSHTQVTTTTTVTTTAEGTTSSSGVSKYYEENVQQGHAPDRTILAAVAREVFEETGLKVTRIEALIDDTCEFGNKKGTVRARKFTFLVDFERTNELEEELKVMLNPAEHQDVMWASEEEVLRGVEVGREAGEGRKIAFAFDDQRGRLLEGFKILKEGNGITGV